MPDTDASAAPPRDTRRVPHALTQLPYPYAALEPTIVTAVNAVTLSATPTQAERANRVRMAVYLMASSYDYQVQR